MRVCVFKYIISTWVSAREKKKKKKRERAVKKGVSIQAFL
jgi:hypothetical protein